MAFSKVTNTPTKEIDTLNYEIIEHIGVLGTSGKWTKELNLISWNKKEAKYDIRAWDRSDESNPIMQKGITLTQEEINRLIELGQ